MRIGVMLRHYDQHQGGVRVYTHKLLPALFEVASGHEFVLLYRNPTLLGTYREHVGVEEVALPAGPKLIWDQVAVRKAVQRQGIELLFNPKYSIPLRVRCPCVWVCHGLDWYVMPWASKFVDRLSHRFLVPRYAAASDAIVAVSETTRQHVIHFLGVAPDRVRTVYSGVADVFRRPVGRPALDGVRARLALPEAFLLYAGAIYPPKNFTRLVRAYAKVGPPRGVALVVAGGQNRFLSEGELREPEALGISEWVHWVGWLEEEDLAACYRLARALLLPSLFEACPLPVMEAMAAGCPIVTSDRYGMKELAGAAAALVDPESVEDVADAIVRVLEDEALRSRLIAAGRERSVGFTWQRCARETLQVLLDAARSPRRVYA